MHPLLWLKSTALSVVTSLVAFCGCNLNWQAQMFCMQSGNIKDWLNPLWFPAAVTHIVWLKPHNVPKLNSTASHLCVLMKCRTKIQQCSCIWVKSGMVVFVFMLIWSRYTFQSSTWLSWLSLLRWLIIFKLVCSNFQINFVGNSLWQLINISCSISFHINFKINLWNWKITSLCPSRCPNMILLE